MVSITVSVSDFIYSTWIPDKYEGSQLINNNKNNKQCSDTQISSQFLDFLSTLSSLVRFKHLLRQLFVDKKLGTH